MDTVRLLLQIDRKMVNTIWFRVDFIRFGRNQISMRGMSPCTFTLAFQPRERYSLASVHRWWIITDECWTFSSGMSPISPLDAKGPHILICISSNTRRADKHVWTSDQNSLVRDTSSLASSGNCFKYKLIAL